jgi:hypothetical protein
MRAKFKRTCKGIDGDLPDAADSFG